MESKKTDVAEHYNSVPEVGLKERAQSRIFFLRNLNNWVKSALINDALQRVRKEDKGSVEPHPITVLDLCCGKGGDLLKWKVGEIRHLICVDIAELSLKQCQSRYEEMCQRMRYGRPEKVFSAEFISADCTETIVSSKFRDPERRLDICSCQFSLHYSFSSEERATCMLRNACENLKVGGYFIGTVPDANRIVYLCRQSGTKSFKNGICQLKFEDVEGDSFPLFASKYHFTLDEVVNCPEYLVYFPLLQKMLEKFNMELVLKKSFPSILYDHHKEGPARTLLGRMQCLEASIA
ncbi:unnamed protein product [Soboliphyme baturini]|uniref:mRNA (guanine-N(7))-methyltransferase n=1 Tax=Soboliphyme baturini TaxID=241478 RepID=A0A183ID41_9BILA|nr:unnamed protein product [Soboliphyme baturini]